MTIRFPKRRTMLKLAVVAFFFVLLSIFYNRKGINDLQIGNLTLQVHKGIIKISSLDNAKQAVLEGVIGLGIPQMAQSPVLCETVSEKNGFCVEWAENARLSVLRQDVKSTQCYRLKWKSLRADHVPMDCFNLKSSFWFGGSEFFNQRWPINNQRIPLQQFRSVDYLTSEETHHMHGPILEPYWFNSKGVAIHVDTDEIPLHVGMNEAGDGRLCLASRLDGSITAKYKHDHHLGLEYTICQAANAKEVHSTMAERFIKRPSKLPDERVLSSPIWSTWARYKTGVNQSNVIEYANEIEKYGFPHSQIEIDDMYTTTYGDFDFDLKKFPDPKEMVDTLHRRKFRVTSWVTPFANFDSKAFTEGLNKKYWIQDAHNRVPGLVQWWQGTGAVLDATNRKAVDWYTDRLEALRQDVGIDSFKFDSGEVGHLPQYVGTLKLLENPNLYTTHYAQVVSRFGGMAEMRAAYRTQNLPIFIRMMDKDSVWGFNNGLMTMIPTALVMSMTGYHYILPDMIGGNGYGMDDPLHNSLLPDRELFIRWVQVSAYLPSMQFSFTPWQYDEEVIKISKDMVQVHEKRVTPAFLKAAKEMLKNGTPIIRPIWWIDPDDQHALAMETEFLVGDEILVAPILAHKARSRDVYLPSGRWRDDLKNTELSGKTWLKGYQAGLDEIPTFTYLKEF